MKKLLPIILIFASFLSYSQTLVQTVNLPSGTFWNSGYGLVYGNQKYWVSSASSTTGKGIVYAVNDAGSVVDTLTLQYPTIRESQGIAFDGTYFWYVERKTARCDIFKVDQNGVVQDSITSTQLFGGSWYMGGAAWDGSGLWVSIYYPNTDAALYKINVDTKTIEDTISVYGTQPTGVTVKGDTLFYVMDGFEGQDERIYAVDLATEDTLFSFHVPEQQGVRQNPRGLAWDGTNFWLLAEPVGSSSGRQLFKYELSGAGSPGITLVTPQLDFGNVMIDSTSTQYIGVYNYGTADLILSQPDISNSVFTIPVTFPVTVQPGQTVNLPVNFIPTANVTYNDSILLYHNDINHPYSKVTVTGTGVYTAPYLVFNPASVSFGSKRNNSTSFIELTFSNQGSDLLTIDSISKSSSEYYLELFTSPLIINPLDEKLVRVWFSPLSSGLFTDSLVVYSNASNGNILYVPLSGSGMQMDPALGNIFWQGQIPDNPGTSFQDYTPRSMKKIQDINGDGKKDLIISTENYWTLAFNGNSSGSADILWKFSTYFGSINTGSVDYVQGLQIAEDLNNDGHQDVVIGTGGGNEFVYALNGLTGEVLWEFGNSSTTSDGDIMGLDVKRDFTNDGIPDVLVSASGNEFNGEGRFSVYLLNGATGSEIWRINQSAEQKLKYMITSTDAGGAVGSRVGTNNEVIGFDQSGNIIWTFPTNGTPWTVREIPNPVNPSNSNVMVGTTTGSVYCLSGSSGDQLWSTSIGNVFIEDLRVISDVNNSGYPDVLISGINPNVYVLEGLNGNNIWSNFTGGNILGINEIGDLNADGLPEVGTASLNNQLHIFNSINGNIIFNYAFGSGSNSTAAEHLSDVDDMDGNLSSEFASCSRDGRVILFSGGTDVVPVELSTFSASTSNNIVTLNWITASELNNYGFYIERKNAENQFKQIAFVEGKGTTTERNYYSFTDQPLNEGKYYYRLRQVDLNGTFEYSNTIEVEIGVLLVYDLEQNYPNPFNPTTTIKYQLPFEGFVSLKIFNSIGEEVSTLVNEIKDPGNYSVIFNSGGLASGIYLYRLEVKNGSDSQKNNFTDIRKMILLK